MARTRSERARSKALAIDDLTQSIEQLQAFIPKLEDLGREGFPYLEGASSRTELQLRECIKRAFGDKSTEFQTHRHLKLAISSATEKKQTLSLIRSLIASLEDKKSELQGLKPAVAQNPSPSANPPQMTLVPPAVATAQVSVTSVTTGPRPTGTTMHLVPDIEKASAPTPPVAAPPQASTPAPPVMESAPTPATPPPVQSLPPRAPIEPISSLFRTQETKPMRPAPAQSPAPNEPCPSVSAPAPAVAAAPSPAQAPFQESDATLSPPSTPAVVTVASSRASKPPAGPGAFSTTQEIPVPVPSGGSQTPTQTADLPATPLAHEETDHLSITKRVCQRFHMVARQLRLRGEYRSTVTVEDEVDVQDLMHALLRLHFDDIGADEWTPAYSNGTPRTTFLLDHDRLAVVVKKTRTGLSRQDLADQVRTDVERYRARGRCTHLWCFIYDPEGRIGNPRGLESELTTISDHFTVDVFVAPK